MFVSTRSLPATRIHPPAVLSYGLEYLRGLARIESSEERCPVRGLRGRRNLYLAFDHVEKAIQVERREIPDLFDQLFDRHRPVSLLPFESYPYPAPGSARPQSS